MQDRIDVIHTSVWKPRFPSTDNQFSHQITNIIITESDTGRIVASKSPNSISMFTKSKRDQPQEAKFLRDCIPRSHVTHKDKTPMPSMEQIKDLIWSRPFSRKLDLIDGYYNIRIHPDSASDSTFTCHIGKFDSLVTQ